LWLEERCPRCGAAAGECCRPRAKRPAASSEPLLHVARGWRRRRCPACQAAAGEPCRSPGGRTASRPHSARLGPARRELAGAEAIWRALERIAASVAVVHLTAARGGRRAKVEVVATAVDGSELRRWRPGESELADALAAPVWARYGTFQRQPPITGDVALRRRRALDHARRPPRLTALHQDHRRRGPTGPANHRRHVARHVARRGGGETQSRLRAL